MMNHFKLPAKIRVFIFEGVVIVRAAGEYLFHLVHLKQFDIHQGLHLEEHFVPCPTGHIPAVSFFGPKHSIAYSKMGQYLYKFPANFLVPVVECSSGTYPEEVFGTLSACENFGHYWDGDFGFFCVHVFGCSGVQVNFYLDILLIQGFGFVFYQSGFGEQLNLLYSDIQGQGEYKAYSLFQLPSFG